MSLYGRCRTALRSYGLALAFGLSLLVMMLAGLGFLTAAFYMWLREYLAPAPAAGLTGGLLLVLATLLALLAGPVLSRLKKPQPPLVGDAKSLAALGVRLASQMVQRDPKKAVILAVIAGVVAEYVLGDEKEQPD